MIKSQTGQRQWHCWISGREQAGTSSVTWQRAQRQPVSWWITSFVASDISQAVMQAIPHSSLGGMCSSWCRKLRR